LARLLSSGRRVMFRMQLSNAAVVTAVDPPVPKVAPRVASRNAQVERLPKSSGPVAAI